MSSYLAQTLIVEDCKAKRDITVRLHKPLALAEIYALFSSLRAKLRRREDRQMMATLSGGIARVSF